MKRILLQFAALYAQVSAAVLTITFVLVYLGEERGQEICSKMSLPLLSCRAVASLLLIVAFSLSFGLTLWRLKERKKKDEKTKT